MKRLRRRRRVGFGGSSLTFRLTEEGPLDLCFVPAGYSGGYDSLSKHASVIVVGAVRVQVASLRDVVTSKRVAGRPKDIVALPPLEAHLRSRER